MFYERFAKLCDDNNIKPTPLLRQLGLSAGNLKNWQKGASVNSDILQKLSMHFNVSIDYLVTGKENYAYTLKMSEEEEELLNNFKNLSEKSKIKIMERIKTLAEIDSEYEKGEKKRVTSIEVHKSHRYIESYTLPASAGAGVDLDGCEKRILEVKNADLINGANFAVKISGNSMEPEFHDGQYALVQTRPKIEQGKIGIFTVNADGYIKKLGAGELISLNPEYDNIQLHEYDDIRCRGEVIGTLEIEDIISAEEY